MPKKKKQAKPKKKSGHSLEDAILLLADDVLKRLAEFGQSYGIQEQRTSLTRPECAAITLRVRTLLDHNAELAEEIAGLEEQVDFLQAHAGCGGCLECGRYLE